MNSAALVRLGLTMMAWAWLVAAEDHPATPAPLPQDTPLPQELVGRWRILSERLFYDKGGGGALLAATGANAAVTRLLELGEKGDWSFGGSKGKWSVSPATDEDWKRWGIGAYGPTRKLVLADWNGGTADGPIEETAQVDFLWVLYRVGPPAVQDPGTAHVKFSRAPGGGGHPPTEGKK
ncbi:MAG: hypothetical protein A3K19_25115 [Lentisphaerae bacterium RIFOXYB12_FULL_65_16]|nr:MAG: hypothetical protein A3K19_25115 [Lentisphaerae bacterium RIFOXYB12_FULL_65_16]